MRTIDIWGLLNVAAACAAFFLAVRAVTLDRRALRTHQASWMLLSCATALLVALLAVDLVVQQDRDMSGLFLLERLIESALVVSLLLGCFYLYVREHQRVAALYTTAEAHTRRSQRLEAILELGNDLRAAHDTATVARLAAQAVERTLAFAETAIYLYDADEDVFRAAEALGTHPDYDAVVRDRRIPTRVLRGVLRDEFRHGNCFFIDHTRYTWTEEELFYFPPGPVPDRGPDLFHADDALFAPLYDRDERLIGMFDVYDPVDGQRPSEETLQMLEVFATVTASALENARYEQELEQQAISDGLTGLYNHRHFQETLVREVERAGRYELVFTLLMMDLDHFKTVNDRLGHPRGDQALRAVADVLRRNARAADYVARYGGEEFVMILPGTSVRQAATLAERIAQGVREIDLDVPDPPPLSISIGMAEHPGCGRDRESLIAAADAALLFAKRSGRDMVADFSQISLVELDQVGIEGLAFRLEKADVETIEALAAAIDQRDAFAGERARAVAATAGELADAMGLEPAHREVLRMAGLVYDIGKVAVPVDVLNRRGRLSDEELAAVRRHPEVGKRLLESAMRLTPLLPVVLHHHERWDGTGYPEGLQGEQIPLAARIIAVCDAWQAMISDRPYRPALSIDEAVAELRAGAGTQFDPQLVETFVLNLARTARPVG